MIIYLVSEKLFLNICDKTNFVFKLEKKVKKFVNKMRFSVKINFIFFHNFTLDNYLYYHETKFEISISKIQFESR